jgi:hypothetical protein
MYIVVRQVKILPAARVVFKCLPKPVQVKGKRRKILLINETTSINIDCSSCNGIIPTCGCGDLTIIYHPRSIT